MERPLCIMLARSSQKMSCQCPWNRSNHAVLYVCVCCDTDWMFVCNARLLVSQGQLYLLVTDQGFLTEEKVVWESLHNVDGDGNFCDSEFRLRPPSNPETVYRGQQDQIDQV